VTFSHTINHSFFSLYYDKVSHNITVFSPTTLKLEACKLTYPPIVKEVGKKVKRIEYEYRNHMGIPGGKFIKTDMLKAIIDNTNVSDDKWFTYLKSVQTEILPMKNVPKPHEDINDAVFLYHIIKRLRQV
jgi:hypothetical protein